MFFYHYTPIIRRSQEENMGNPNKKESESMIRPPDPHYAKASP